MAKKKIPALLAATEPPDMVQFFGTVAWPEIIGTMNAKEELDTIGFNFPPGAIFGNMSGAALPPTPPPPGYGTIEAGVEYAILTLWPGAGFPEGLKPRDRNTAICELLKSRGCTLPATEPGLDRAVQRVLRKLRTHE
jgi:hypothetical protein